ncbi:MAG: MFS transporter [Planctomycetaceae bacterium]
MSEVQTVPSGGDGSDGGSDSLDEGSNALPPTLATPTFAGFVTTQFLGAFNDNYFKQLVLLACLNEKAASSTDLQPLAVFAFALPFVLLSGFGGFLSDRFSRQRIIVACKVGEIGVMALSLLVLLIPGLSSRTQLMLLIAVLGFMGAQSALFGPSKYGSLPELFRPEQLLPVNGIVQMTTFLAIIFGMVAAGVTLDYLDRSLWPGSVIAVGIAIAGTLTSLLIRRTRAANPSLSLRPEHLGIPRDIRTLLKNQPPLYSAILIASVFWFIGGITQPAVNTLGREMMGLSETRASVLAASIGVGIASGCIAVGVLGKHAGPTWVMRGAWGMILSLFSISLLASQTYSRPGSAGTDTVHVDHQGAVDDAASGLGVSSSDTTLAEDSDGVSASEIGPSESGARESIVEAIFHAPKIEWALRFCMAMLGFFAGTFVVPLQVYIQQAPSQELKGRVLGTQNLINWIGIVLSAVFLIVYNLTLASLFDAETLSARHHIIFTILAILLLPIAFYYRLPARLDTE